jgi:hypothetical protein
VAHTGALAGISCAKFDPLTGLSPFDALRTFDLQQSNPPTGPLNGIGSTFFTPDSTALITTVKGNPKAPAAQLATCWSTISQSTGTGFVTDVGVNRLVEMDLMTGEVVGEVNSGNGNPGMLDLQASGVMVYALAPGNGSTAASVAVFDVSGERGVGREVQNFGVQGADNRAMGMAFFA